MKQIRVCKSGACSSFGAKRVMEKISKETALEPGEKNNEYDLDYCGCLGWCAKSPCVEIDENKILFSCEPETVMKKIINNEGVVMEEEIITLDDDTI